MFSCHLIRLQDGAAGHPTMDGENVSSITHPAYPTVSFCPAPPLQYHNMERYHCDWPFQTHKTLALLIFKNTDMIDGNE